MNLKTGSGPSFDFVLQSFEIACHEIYFKYINVARLGAALYPRSLFAQHNEGLRL
jgi:hypothetical protein